MIIHSNASYMALILSLKEALHVSSGICTLQMSLLLSFGALIE